MKEGYLLKLITLYKQVQPISNLKNIHANLYRKKYARSYLIRLPDSRLNLESNISFKLLISSALFLKPPQFLYKALQQLTNITKPELPTELAAVISI